MCRAHVLGEYYMENLDLILSWLMVSWVTAGFCAWVGIIMLLGGKVKLIEFLAIPITLLLGWYAFFVAMYHIRKVFNEIEAKFG